MTSAVATWLKKLSIPLVCSCVPWLYILIALRSTTDDEGVYIYGALLGGLSFLATGPIAATQLHLMYRQSKLTLRNLVLLYYAVCAPVITFQAFTSSSILMIFAIESLGRSNWAQISLLTLLLGIILYTIVNLVFGIVVYLIDRSVL
jgi:hypothetical protein